MMDDLERQPLIKSEYQNGQALPGFSSGEQAFGASLTQSLKDAQNQLKRGNVESDLKFGLTPVRRTFCLLAVFDALLIFLLWIMYAQVNVCLFLPVCPKVDHEVSR